MKVKKTWRQPFRCAALLGVCLAVLLAACASEKTSESTQAQPSSTISPTSSLKGELPTVHTEATGGATTTSIPPPTTLAARAATTAETKSSKPSATSRPAQKATQAPTTTVKATGAEPIFLSDFEAQVVSLVNQERAKQGLAPLTKTTALDQTARVRVVEISQKYSHDRPDGSACFTAFPDSNAAGENIARGSDSPASVMSGWMNSSTHRSNILNGSFVHIGVGCYQKNGQIYWVQCFTGA